MIVGAVAVLALVGLLGFVIGRGQTSPASSAGAVAAPGTSGSPATEPISTSTESAAPSPGAPTESAGRSLDALPDSATVRRPPVRD